jgi:FG-GAP-like repeat/EF hand
MPGDVALPFAPESLAAADVDGDGKLDLIAAGGTANTIAVLKGNGDGTFSAPVTYPASSPVRLAIADLDGDGHLDIAACGGGVVTILYGPTFAAASTKSITAGTRLMGIAAADLDGDGKVDLVVADAASSTVSNVVVLLNQGARCSPSRRTRRATTRTASPSPT